MVILWITYPLLKDSVESYLIRIKQIPLLTAEEEFELGVKYRKYNDMEAAHKLITSNLRFVVKVALEYRTYGVKLADLIQEGNIGLMMAVKISIPIKGIDSSLMRFGGFGRIFKIL